MTGDFRHDHAITEAVLASVKDHALSVDVDDFHASLAAAGLVVVPHKPEPGLLASMATRLRHDFGLMDDRARRALLVSMGQIYEEATLQGFYRPDKEGDYRQLLPKDEG